MRCCVSFDQASKVCLAKHVAGNIARSANARLKVLLVKTFGLSISERKMKKGIRARGNTATRARQFTERDESGHRCWQAIFKHRVPLGMREQFLRREAPFDHSLGD